MIEAAKQFLLGLPKRDSLQSVSTTGTDVKPDWQLLGFPCQIKFYYLLMLSIYLYILWAERSSIAAPNGKSNTVSGDGVVT